MNVNMAIDWNSGTASPSPERQAKTGGASAPRADDPATLKAHLKDQKAACDFEAMLLAPVLDSLQKTVSGSNDSTVGASDYCRMGTEALSQAIAARGGIGIAKIILQHLQTAKLQGKS
jgi:Rod binding domain-containing protein